MILRGMIWRFLVESGMIIKPPRKAKSKNTKDKTKKRKSKGIIKINKW